MPALFTMILGAALMVCLSATSAFAQWITLRTPGIPRAASGEVDLSAPPPSYQRWGT